MRIKLLSIFKFILYFELVFNKNKLESLFKNFKLNIEKTKYSHV